MQDIAAYMNEQVVRAQSPMDVCMRSSLIWLIVGDTIAKYEVESGQGVWRMK